VSLKSQKVARFLVNLKVAKPLESLLSSTIVKGQPQSKVEFKGNKKLDKKYLNLHSFYSFDKCCGVDVGKASVPTNNDGNR